MADRYQDRPFPAHDDYGRGTDQHGQKDDSDPLAELARLIGQTDPFAMSRANAKAQPQAAPRAAAPQQPPQQQQQQPPQQQQQPAPRHNGAERGLRDRPDVGNGRPGNPRQEN